VLAQARAVETFTAAHQSADAGRHKLGDTAGTRRLIEVVLVHRTRPFRA
jgi:hypothetical protein